MKDDAKRSLSAGIKNYLYDLSQEMAFYSFLGFVGCYWKVTSSLHFFKIIVRFCSLA